MTINPSDARRYQPAAAASVSGVVPKPRMTWRGVGIAALLWLTYTVLYSVVISLGAEVPLVWVLPSQFVATLILAVYSLPVWVLMIRQMDGLSWIWKIAAHLVIGPLYAWLSFWSYLWLLAVFVDPMAVEQVGGSGQWVLYGNLTIYILQFAVYHTIRSVQRLQVQERQAAALQALAQERELAALKAQVNPHFLFNTLNSISAMVNQNAEEARAMIADLADLLRYTLDSSKRDLVPLREELSFARAYLALEAHRFSDRLDVRYEIEPAALEVLLPPVVLQPLVENAVKHGIGPREAGGAITLRATVTDRRLEVSVEDTGAGLNGRAYPSATSNGIGLANTSARLERLFGPAASLHTEAVEPHGFRVSFSIPLETVGVSTPST